MEVTKSAKSDLHKVVVNSQCRLPINCDRWRMRRKIYMTDTESKRKGKECLTKLTVNRTKIDTKMWS
ncbi:hypothetical protein LOAG_08972 [Loa loa]|uniref:Uncharacterized protein n=1 Tax=Loa loa TaxID=7209 RepID=A0A1S0TSR9_LOALO|nr:hypothetical protein LOAG_08972 [Loa loa]EFO19521.2 hypothetical protein LOAG_08972 [Loa loa]